MSRKSEAYTQGETKNWDIGGDAWSTLDDSVGYLEVANLSLDEPQMEAVLFTDDGEGGEEINTVTIDKE